VERRERDQRPDLGVDVRVDDDRVAKARAAVDDAVRDRVHVLRERLDRARAIVFDDMELDARRARVDDEDS
jgi:hypothetical protein